MNESFLLFSELLFIALYTFTIVVYDVNNVLDLKEISNIHRISGNYHAKLRFCLNTWKFE